MIADNASHSHAINGPPRSHMQDRAAGIAHLGSRIWGHASGITHLGSRIWGHAAGQNASNLS